MIYHVQYGLEFYREPSGGCPVEEFLDSLQKKPQAKVLAWLDWLKKEGPDIPRPYADLLEGPIRELRVSFSRLEIRLLYFIEGRQVVVTHGFLKKTRRIDPREIERAKRYRDLWLFQKGSLRMHDA